MCFTAYVLQSMHMNISHMLLKYLDRINTLIAGTRSVIMSFLISRTSVGQSFPSIYPPKDHLRVTDSHLFFDSSPHL